VRIAARVSDNQSGGLDVQTTYTVDGQTWKHAQLQPSAGPAAGSGAVFMADVDAPANGRNIFVIVEARDKSGNVTTDTAKGSLYAFSFTFLPLIRR
jgi:hypothetical protein